MVSVVSGPRRSPSLRERPTSSSASLPRRSAAMPAGIKTTPLDPRFPNQNQSQHCWYACYLWHFQSENALDTA